MIIITSNLDDNMEEIKNKTFVFGGQEGQQQATQIYQITP